MSTTQRMLFDRELPATETEAGSFAGLCRLLGANPGPNWPDRFGGALNAWATSAIKAPIKTLSLFSGAGGLDIAFHDAGFRIETAVEINDRFAATLRANTGGAATWKAPRFFARTCGTSTPPRGAASISS